MNLAPVVLFVYNRPKHTREALNSLSMCKYASDTKVYIFSDAPKKESAVSDVEKVRAIIRDELWRERFQDVCIIEAEHNKGLANSVISGVSQVINEHGSVIVLEDDNRVANDYLDYMNRALEYYKDDQEIGFIGAYKAPIKIPEDYAHDVFKMGRGSSYSWATWKERWDLVDWKVSDYQEFKHDHAMRRRFNEYGADRATMLDNQMAGRIDSWAIRFSYAMFKHGKYAILPVKTRVENIGFDGTGVHNVAADTRFLVKIDPDLKPATFDHVEVDPRIKKEFVKLFQTPFPIKVKRVLKRMKENIGG